MTQPGTQVGDASGGYSVSTDGESGEIHVTAWGFWSIDVATSFRPTVLEACTTRPSKRLVLDMQKLRPMRDEGQQGVSAVMVAVPGLGIQRVTVITSSQLTKLQLLRIVRETVATDRVDFVDRTEAG